MAVIDQISISRVEQQSRGRQSAYLYDLSDGVTRTHVRVVRRRRKTMALQVEKDQVTELRAPLNCSWHEIYAFLQVRFEWILNAEKEMSERVVAPRDRFCRGGEISFLGRRLPLDVVASSHRIVCLDRDSIMVSGPNPADSSKIERQVKAWLRRQAESLFDERIALLNPAFGDDVSPTGLRIRQMKSRWGSCSSSGEICLSLMLIREDLSQIDFVVTHELCHLRHFGHNKSFYGLMDRVMPDWKHREAQLSQA